MVVASGFATSMAALRTIQSLNYTTNTASSSYCRVCIISEPIHLKRRVVRRGASLDPRSEAMAEGGDQGESRVSSISLHLSSSNPQLQTVDDRVVVKQFDWPEHKAYALREVAFGYCDLKKLEFETSSF